MIRQRIHVGSRRMGTTIGRLLVSILAVALIFYGLMVILAALKLSPHALNHVSAYQTIDHRLTSITAAGITGQDRIIIAVAGVACLLVFAPLTWQALPRPFLARHATELDGSTSHGHTELAPRAIERAAEIAARGRADVVRARARAGADSVEVRVELHAADHLLSGLQDVQRRVRDTLSDHGLPTHEVDVTLTRLTAQPQETR